MRLFTAIGINEGIKEGLGAAVAQLKEMGISANYTKLANMHLTLCFIGETKTPTKASDAMDEIFQDPFTLELSYLFMLRKGLMAVGFQPSNELLNLHSNLSAALEDKGFSIEKRAFSAHLTIARNVPAEVSGADLRAISLPKEKILVDRFSLMLSERKKGGVAYTPLYTRYLA